MSEQQLELPLEGPRHKHDCRGTDCCQYLHTYFCVSRQVWMDVYFSKHEEILIYRYSSDGPDYITHNVRYLL
ncbi:hypothetical protein DSS3PM1_00101 [Bacteriophage DSS3_PM1]|nr:hypothetical protein DSS3PM1_00101 [Bacteriophage DSS3_PM1]